MGAEQTARRLPVVGTVLVLGTLPVSACAAAAVDLVVGATVHVTSSRSEAPHVEPYLAAHPADPQILVGAAVTFEGEEPTVVAFGSSDGGTKWTLSSLPVCRVDPWVDFDTEGRAHLSCLTDDYSVKVFGSSDAGRSWSGARDVPSAPGGRSDRPILVADRSGGLRSGPLCVIRGQWSPVDPPVERAFGPSVSCSSAAGGTFEAPAFLHHDGVEQQPFAAAALSDGDLVFAFMDFVSGGRLLRHRRTWIAIWRHEDRSFSLPTLAVEQLDAEMPWALAVDLDRHLDRLYMAIDGSWQREPADIATDPESRKGLQVSYSDDRGVRWSSPVSVSDLPGSNQETPALAVNQRGEVGVAWYDTRRTEDRTCFDVYFALSVDGGRSFSENARLTAETSCPRAARHPGVARRWAFGGDYSGLAAAADGSFHVAWADTQSETYQIRTVRIEKLDAPATAGE